jgi:hypothetical protein
VQHLKRPSSVSAVPPPQGTLVNPWIILGIVLFVAWAVLWLMFRIATGLIHLLVIIAIAMFIWGLVKRGARAVNRRV